MPDPGGMHAGIVIAVLVDDGIRVKDHQIRVVALGDDALVPQPDLAGGERGHLADGLLKGKDALLTHITAKDAGIGGVGARVGSSAHEPVGDEAHGGVAHDRGDVRLVEPERDHAHGELFFHQQVEGGVGGVGMSPFGGDLRDALAHAGLVGFADHRRDEDLFPAHGLREVFPVHARVEVMLDGAALLAQGPQQAVHAPAVVPRRDDHMQERAPRRIGVLGHRDVDPGGAGLVDAPDERGGAAPVLFPADLEVGDHGGDAGAFADGDHLFHGFGDGVGLVAHVHVVDAAVRRRGLGYGYRFLKALVAARRVDQPGGDAARALVHAPGDQIPHGPDFVVFRGPVGHAHDAQAHRAEPHVRGDVERRLRGLQAVEVFRKAVPCPRHVERPGEAGKVFLPVGLVAVLDRREGHAVQPEVFGGYALHDLAVHALPGEERQFRMAVPVHEAGAERLAVHILHAAGAGRGAGGEHGGDGAAFHAHITVEPRVARAVDDLRIAEQNIKHGNAPSHAAESPRRL